MLEVLESEGDWIYREDQDPGPSRMCADIGLAREKLGYKPRYSLKEGLERMIRKDKRFQTENQAAT